MGLLLLLTWAILLICGYQILLFHMGDTPNDQRRPAAYIMSKSTEQVRSIGTGLECREGEPWQAFCSCFLEFGRTYNLYGESKN